MNVKVVALLICLSCAYTRCGCDGRPTIHVTVANLINGSTITVHCYSGDNDLGYHQLAFLEPLSWSFSSSPLGNTKFICTITTNKGSGSYVVYKDEYLAQRCGVKCVWEVRPTGPCLEQTHDVPWCQPWQK